MVEVDEVDVVAHGEVVESQAVHEVVENQVERVALVVVVANLLARVAVVQASGAGGGDTWPLISHPILALATVTCCKYVYITVDSFS